MNFEKILICSDLSDTASGAFELPAYSSKMDGSQLTLVSVIEDWQVPPVFLRQIPDPAKISEYRDELKSMTQKHLEDIASKHFHNQKIDCVTLLNESTVADEICNFAKEKKSSLIVMASHGRGAIGTLVMGSTVQKVLAKAPCPVLVVPKNNK